ncbi:MAG TPA: hypothetical protein VKB14_08425 [Actinomycetales bacterium]|nr:hypothetical protein [Actinomycetales bacterium]
MSSNKIVLSVGAALAAGGLLLGGSALANAADGTSPAPVASTAGGYDGGRGGGSADTPVTGSEAAKVTAAVKAKDSAVSVTGVRKDPDGSYDVLGTKSGTQVFYDVSKDLKTITERTGGPGGGHGRGGHGRGGSADTPVTGSEAAKVTAAVKAKDSAVSVTSVRKDPDGSYDVLGTKSGTQVFYDVSKDLKTITQNTFGGGQSDAAPSASNTSTT